MPDRRPVAARREQLIEAALAVAARDGVQAATVREVAAEAGVSLGVVHYCFTSKDELFIEMAKRIIADSVEASAASMSALAQMSEGGLSVRPMLSAATDALWATIVNTPGLQLLTYEITTHSLRHPELRQVATEQYDAAVAGVIAFLDLVAELVGFTWTRPTERIAGSVLSYIDGVSLRWLVDSDDDNGRERLEDMVDLLVSMVAE